MPRSIETSARRPTRSSNGRTGSSTDSEPPRLEKDRHMPLSRTAIVQGLQKIVGPANVITDEQELKQSSIDRLRLYEDVHGVFTRPLPAAVVMARSTQHVADVLKFANDN